MYVCMYVCISIYTSIYIYLEMLVKFEQKGRGGTVIGG